MPKFESSIKVGALESLTGNTTLLHLGADNRVGILTDAPESELHVDGTITARGLVVPSSVISSQGDSAAIFGFNPNFSEWNGPPDNHPNVANGYTQIVGTKGSVEQSFVSNLGNASARFNDAEAVWKREVSFLSPLYANVFLQGTMAYKYESWSEGEPGLAITLTHREKANSDTDGTYDDGTIKWTTDSTNTFIVPTLPENRDSTGWVQVPWRAHTPGNREITKLKVEVVSTKDKYYNTSSLNVHNDGGAGNSTYLGSESSSTNIDYDWYLDGFSFAFMHPDMRIDQLGRITGAYIEFATITDAHIKNYIASTSSRIYDNPAPSSATDVSLTSIPVWHPEYPELTNSDGTANGTGLIVDALVANSSYANGWSIDKYGTIKGTDIKIYSSTGKVLISGSGRTGDPDNPFGEWFDWAGGGLLEKLDPEAASYLYGISFEESNSTDLRANTRFLYTDGLGSPTFVANDHAVHIANNVTGETSPLANGTITFNGITSNAPPGSILTGENIDVIKNQDGYILFLSNTHKWSSDTGIYQNYHANTLLGEYGLYVFGRPTVGGWLYHPHANNTWYTIDENQTGERLHQNDFLVIGRMSTDASGKVRADRTYLQPPKHPDSIVDPAVLGSYPPIGITAGGVLFADIHLNQYAHTANSGEIQMTNQRNLPNTRFTFIHPGTNDPNDSVVYTVNGAYGVLTSLEDFPGSRYITFIGSDQSRFTLEDGHSSDFVAAFPIGERWFYNQDEGKFSEFTPSDKDCIVARVDANGSVNELTNIYRYAEREIVTSEGAPVSDMIIDPPRGMAYGGLVFADFHKNLEYDNGTLKANAGFISFTNSDNTPNNEFYVIHPENGNSWFATNVERGVATSLDSKTDSRRYGTRHIAFVGSNTERFPAVSSYLNTSNDFIAVAKYNDQGQPRSDGKWYYDNGVDLTNTFAPDANDFIVATINSYNPSDDTPGIDQLTRWSAREGQIFINGELITITSLNDILNAKIKTVNTLAQTALSEAQSAYANAVAASANVELALGLLDGAITVYFEEEDASEGYANNGTGNFGYNDLWINVSPYNEYIDGSWSSNAIFRYANVLGGFANSTGGFGGTDDGLGWRHDRTNLQGLAYLKALTARGYADRATTIYYMDKIGSDPYYGPNVATLTVSGPDASANRIRFNANPEGDFWYDTTTGSDLNHPYVYRTNTSFSTSNAYGLSLEPPVTGYTNGVGTIGEWSQTVYAATGDFDPTSDPTGWYDIRDTAFTESTDDTARGLANNALSAAANAQFAADREVLAFFKDFASGPFGAPDPTGNGDVWIHTDNAIRNDGTLNVYAIHVSNTADWGIDSGADDPLGNELYWHTAPNNAIGLMYLRAYSQGIAGEYEHGTNLMPRGLSLFDAPSTDYEFGTGSYSSVVPYAFTRKGTSDVFGKFSDAYIDTDITSTRGNTYFNNKSLKIVTDLRGSGQTESIFRFSNNTSGSTGTSPKVAYSIGPIDKDKNYILSYYAKVSNTGSQLSSATIRTYIEQFSDTSMVNAEKTDSRGTPYSDEQAFSSDDTWQRFHQYYTSFHANVKNIILNFKLGVGTTTGFEYFIDGIQLEEVPDNVYTPSQFKEPSDGKAIVFGREITDGKIITHYSNNYYNSGLWYGPIPNETPTGLPNPEPDGDFWVNTGNNNILFRYYQNSIVNFAQTVYWTTDISTDLSGWYTTEDLRTSNALTTSYEALANAATAQAAADREIIAFFNGDAGTPAAPENIVSDSDNPDATGNGDIWIKTDSFATLNTSSIYTWRADLNGGSGYWHQSPTSAIGQVYLEAWLAGEQADRTESLSIAISGGRGFDFPIAPATNGIFVGATGNLAFHVNRQDDINDVTPGTILVTNEGGIDFVGPNGSIWYSVSGDYGIPTTDKYIDTPYDPTEEALISNNGFLMYSNMNAATRFNTGLYSFGTHHHIIPVIWDTTELSWNAVDNANTWYPFVPDHANGDFLVAELRRPFNFSEGIQRLDSWVFDILPRQNKEFLDSKIVTHYSNNYYDSGLWYGPRANLTPTGMHNPDPFGDLWVNTGNNNIIFRYQTNSINNWAQTVYWAANTEPNPPTGWYTTEDPRAQTTLVLAESARQAAADSQAAADREIIAFFEQEALPPTDTTGNGDIWIVTDHARYEPDPTNQPGIFVANTRSIRVANAQNSGVPATPGGSPTRWWNESPNNAIGITYLQNFISANTNRGLLDGKIVTHYGPHYVSGGSFYGPKPQITPTGEYNRVPHGDFWINTSNNNLEFIYNQNNSPSAEKKYAQTIIWSVASDFVFNESSDLSGWYSTEDPRSQTALTVAYSGLDLAETAREAAANSQAAADREIIAFFSHESSPPTETTGNGDIWIVTDYLFKPGTFVSNTTSIRVANTKNSGVPATGSPVERWWNISPNNAIGITYLENFVTANTNRAIADGKIVTHYSNNYYDSGLWYGPVPNTTPSGGPNPTPYGDFWINTGNNNLEFIYLSNSENYWAQTIYWSSNTEPNPPAGWYSTEDPRAQTAFQAAFDANAAALAAQITADEAYRSANLAQIAADREIVAFFQPASAVGTSAVYSTGFGDIWIQTDDPVHANGTPNTAAIYRSNSASGGNDYSVWVSNSTFGGAQSAIGMAYLQSYASGVSGSYQRGDNIMPRGYSLWDAPLNDYLPISNNFMDTSIESIARNASDVRVPYPLHYRNFSYIFKQELANVAIDRTGGSNAYIGSSSLRITTRVEEGLLHNNSEEVITLGVDLPISPLDTSNNQPYAIDIPRGKKWIFSYFIKANTTVQSSTRARFSFANSTNSYAGSHTGELDNILVSDTWQRYSEAIDLSTSDLTVGAFSGGWDPVASAVSPRNQITTITPIFSVNSSSSQAIDYFIDGVQLEEATGNVASRFREPSDAGSIIFGRTISDGKIITRYEKEYSGYGPEPHITPTGIHNPVPHGDSWYNVTNNNVLFIYHQNSTNYTAQSIFYPSAEAEIAVDAPSGWYSVTDYGLLSVNVTAQQALSEARLSQIAADREINVFFEKHSNTETFGTGNGDVWIQVDNAVNPNGSPNTFSIFVYNSEETPNWTQSRNNAIGIAFLKSLVDSATTNWMPRGWSTFDVGIANYSNGATNQANVYLVPYPISPEENVEYVIDTTKNPPVSGNTLRLTKTNGDASANVFIGANSVSFFQDWTSNPRAIEIPQAKKWVLSYYTKVDELFASDEHGSLSADTLDSGIRIYVGNNTYSSPKESYIRANSYYGTNRAFETTDWERHWIVFDLTGGQDGTGTLESVGFDGAQKAHKANTANRMVIRIDPAGEGSASGNNIWYSGFHLEDVTDTSRITPGKFQEPSSRSDVDFSRAISDGKIVTHYQDEGDNGNGPNPQWTPTGQWNPTPYGDLWINTSNNNIMFRYYQNSSDFTTNTSFFVYGAGRTFDENSSESGWYTTEDLRAQTALENTEVLAANVSQALQDAAFALVAADAEILVFFEPSTNSSMILSGFAGAKTGPATGNGDIWIHTDFAVNEDGTANNKAIYFANLGLTSGVSPGPGVTRISDTGWTQSPDNAIGRGFVEQFASTGVKNWMPSGYSTWDENPNDYSFTLVDDAEPVSFPLVGGKGSANPQVFADIDTSFGVFSGTSLRLDTTGDNPTVLYLSNTSLINYNSTHAKQSPSVTTKIPRGKRWIFSYYVYSNSTSSSTANPLPKFTFSLDDDSTTTTNVAFFETGSINTERNRWVRNSFVIDLSNTHIHANASGYTDTTGKFSTVQSKADGGLPSVDLVESRLANLNSLSIKLKIENPAAGTTGNTFWFDGLQLEEAPGARVTPGQFSDPDRRISTNFSRAISDGKVVSHYANGTTSGLTYYGPKPQETPSGAFNPVPHGDFWVDTANNNALYRYHQNNFSSIPTSQTAYWASVAFIENENSGVSQSGWYSIQDGRLEILAGNVATAFGSIEEILQSVADLESTADGELLVHFEDEGGDFQNAVSTYSPVSYGDLWINTSDYNKLANGALSTNSIFRWQNSLNGYVQSGSPNQLAWRHAPENAIGQVYLQTYSAQNTADQKVTAYFMGGNKTGEGFYGPPYDDTLYKGPQTNTTPTGTYNPNPDGDIWIDTSNNNLMYVYHYNGGTHAQGFQQKIYYTSVTNLEGWYSAEDLRVAAHDRALEIAAATGTDRVVEIFANTVPPSASGNGDIWIKTTDILNPDGTANLNAIYVANTESTGGIQESEPSSPSHYWYSTPTSALGRTYLESLVSETASNRIPRGYSTWDSVASNYQIKQEGAVTEFTKNIPHPILIGGGHSSVVNTTFGKVSSGSLQHNSGWLYFANNLPQVGPPYARPKEKFNAPSPSVTLEIPTGKKWIFSYYAYSNSSYAPYPTTTDDYVQLNLMFNDNTDPNSNVVDFTSKNYFTVRNQWQRFSHVFDFSNTHVHANVSGYTDRWNSWDNGFQSNQLATSKNGSVAFDWHEGRLANLNSMTIRLDNKSVPTGTPGANTIWYDGFQLEEVVGERATPSPIQEPSPASEVDFSRAISDGKTINFVSNAYHDQSNDHKWGPNPSTTPNGLTNPEPYGDKWISMSPPYKSYLYFSNSTNKTSQTVYHSNASWTPTMPVANTNWPFGVSNNNSGWYEYRDTGSALTQEGWQVKLGQVSLENTTWTENDDLSVLLRRIGFIEDWLENPIFPALDIGDTSNFGQTRELLLNPVPPPDTNLHAHWTMNSFDVDGDGNFLIRDVSGRNNHALIRKTDSSGNPVAFPGMSSFPDHDPASDFINVSGNRSVLLNSIYNGTQPEFLILASNGASEHTKTYNGNQYPLNITQTTGDSGGYNKTTLVFWYKPTIGDQENAALVGQDRDSGLGGSWGLNFYKDGSTNDGMNANNDISINWHLEDSGLANYLLTHDEANPLDGWYGANDAGTYTPVRNNEWHLFAIQTNHDQPDNKDTQTLWIYREGEGLLYHKTRTFSSGATDASTPARGLYLNGDAYQNYTQTRNNTKGYYDEVRLYNTILTPRNIRYLYMNPTGRPRQLQPRPGLAVKEGYSSFTSKSSNAYAYFHGFDVDGNPADVSPYVSVDGRVKYLKANTVLAQFPSSSERNKYTGNTIYFMYKESGWGETYYRVAMPVGNNTTDNPDNHTWRSIESASGRNWEYFTPDESVHYVIGEGRFANSNELSGEGVSSAGYAPLKNIKVYQSARSAQTIRESYNFNIYPENLMQSGLGGFFANADFWASKQLDGMTYIADLSVSNAQILSMSAAKIETGILEAKVQVGGEAKIVIDGFNSRIVISD